jgi:6-pyruvoyl-tetrahydropterin synthase
MSTGTRVGAILCAAHRAGGRADRWHGHTWVVWATFENCLDDAIALKGRLQRVLDDLDHGELPDSLARGEALAAHVGLRLAGSTLVEVERPLELISAWWRP